MFLSSESIRPIFQPDVDKLLSHVHHVLAAPSQINTAVTFSIATKSPSATSLNLKKPTKDHKKDNIPSVFHTSYILTALHVLSSLLLLVQSSLGLEATLAFEDEVQDQDQQMPSPVQAASLSHTGDNILFQNSFRRELLFGSRSSHVSLASQCARLELLKAIESTVCSYWNLSTSNQSSISTSAFGETYQILSSLALLSLPLSAILMNYTNSTSISTSDQASALSHHSHLYQVLFTSFPYQSEEGAIAPTGSTLESESKKRIETLNMILCESSFVGYLRYLSVRADTVEEESRQEQEGGTLTSSVSSQREMREIINLSSDYLSASVASFSQKMKRQQNYFKDNSLPISGKSRTPLQLEPEDEESQDLSEEKQLAQRGRGGALSESLLRIFRCLSYQSNYMIRSRQHQAKDFLSQFIFLLNQFSSLLSQLLSLLNSFTTLTTSPKIKTKMKVSNSKETLQLLFAIEKILMCNCRMIREDDLWDITGTEMRVDAALATLIEGRNESLLALLRNICQIPTVVCKWMSSQGVQGKGEEGEISDSILRHVCHILLVMITRGGIVNSDEETQTGGQSLVVRQGSDAQWRLQLNQLICNTIDEIFQPSEEEDSGSMGDSLYLKCHFADRRHWFDVWFYCQFEPSQRREVLMNLLTDLLCGAPKTSLSSDEQSYFLNLLYLKRYEFAPNDLISILISSFEAHKSAELSVSSPHAIDAFQQWSHMVANLLYLCSPSSHSLSVIKMLLPALESLLTVETTADTTLGLAFPRTYFNCYLHCSLLSNLLRRYRMNSSPGLSAPLVSHTVSLPSADHQQLFTQFISLFIESLVQYLTDDLSSSTATASSSHSLLQAGWSHLKHSVMVTSDTTSTPLIISNQWLLDILQTQWCYPGETSTVCVDIWEELLKRLGEEVFLWSERLLSGTSEERDVSRVGQRCLSLLNHLFEVIQYLKTTHCLTVERTRRVTEFLAVVKKNLTLSTQIEEYLLDLDRYMT
jgi:hypothetical protein